MLKSVLRKSELVKRMGLTEAEFKSLNDQLFLRFTQLNFSEVRTLHFFLPIEQKREPDTFLMINWITLHHPLIKILVPRADFNSFLMTHHEYPGAEKLVKNAYNILEPAAGNAHNDKIDVVIVPLLAFDKKGARVGYGKGFYDRFLNEHHEAMKVGLSLFPPVNNISDADDMDVLLDGCLTPQETYIFKKNSFRL